MGLSWQQGPLSAGAIGHFLTPEPLPDLLHEPGRYPVAYFSRVREVLRMSMRWYGSAA
ncbi:hypothetical protein SAMN06272765_0049 [Streptomyces sp. Ag109_G2-15]|nr:hypothetical protein SAMN06272765_0049 [Streptomyces sp. Ag109_G2-15]